MGSLGEFERIRRIGRGAMGEVWEAIHRTSRVRVALKTSMLDEEGAGSDPSASGSDAAALTEVSDPFALSHEIRAMARLDHECIAPIYDHGIDKGKTWFASGFAALGDLRANRPTCWEDAQEVLEQVLRALAHAHSRGVIHRDLKPGNVLITAAGGVWLTDFGIAWSGQGAEVAGTPRYMAPEQVCGWWRHFGPWTDLYALGCLAWWLVTGSPPFAHVPSSLVMRAQVKAPIPKLTPSFPIPDSVESWLRKLLAKRPSQRFLRAPDALASLRQLTQDRADTTLVPASHDPQRDPQLPLPTSHRFAAAGLALLDVRPTPLVGRDDEFSQLTHHLRACRRGAFRAVAVLGSGMGCTHLTESFARQASERGAACWLRLDATSPVRLLASMANACGLGGLPPEERDRNCRRWLARHPEATRAQLNHLLNGTLDLPGLAHLIHAFAPRATTILVVHGDLSEPLREALEGIDAQALVLADDTPIHGTTLHLGPLGPQAIVQLGWCMAGIDAETSRELQARLAGSPSAIARLIRDWVAQGVLRATDRGTELATDPFAGLHKNRTIAAQVRSLALDASETSTLQLLCLAGPQLHHVDLTQADRAMLELLVAHRLAHRSATHSWLDPRLCHWVVARVPSTKALWARAADRLREPTSRLECLIRADRTEEAVQTFIDLADTGHARSRRLGELWRILHPKVHDPKRSFELELARLQLLRTTRQLQAAVAGYAALASRTPTPGRRVRVLRRLADVLRLAGRSREAIPHLEEAIGLTRRHKLPGVGRLMMLYGLSMGALDSEDADLFLEEAEDLASDEGDAESLGIILLARGRRELARRHLESAVSSLQGALQLPISTANRAAALGMLAGVLSDLDRTNEAHRVCTEAVNLSEERASQHLAAMLATHAKIYLRRGEVEAAWRCALRAQQVAARRNQRSYIVYATLMLARIGAERGEPVGDELHRLRSQLGDDFVDCEVADVLMEVAEHATGLDRRRALALAAHQRRLLAKN